MAKGFSRFGILGAALGIAVSFFVISCRHSPTEPPSEPECCGRFTLILRDSSHHPIGGAFVALLGSPSDTLWGRTNEDGIASFDSLCPGQYIFLVAAPSASHPWVADGRFTLDSCQEIQRELQVPWPPRRGDQCCDGVLEVVVKEAGAEHHRIAGAAVVLKNVHGVPIQTRYTDSSGIVVFSSLCPGVYTVVVEAEGYQRYQVEVNLPCNGAKELPVLLVSNMEGCCDNTVRIQVRNQQQEPIAHAQVRLVDAERQETIRSGVTRGDGIVEWAAICEGTYVVYVTYATVNEHGDSTTVIAIEDFAVECHENRTVVVVLATAGERQCCHNLLRVVVRTEEQPVSDAEVRLRRLHQGQSEHIETGHTDEHGVVWFDGICQGTYEVRIAHPEYPVQEIPLEFDCDTRRVDLIVIFEGSRASISIQKW